MSGTRRRRPPPYRLVIGVGCAISLAAPASAARGDGDGVHGEASATYTHVFVPASGQLDLQGHDPGASLRETEGRLELQLLGGTRGLGYATLRSHLLGQLLLDPYGSPTGDTASGWPSIVHDPEAEGRLLIVHLAHVELDGLTERGALADIHLRAGRQFHWGFVPLTFDGVTAGYDDGRAAVAIRAGRRAAVYDPDPHDAEIIAGVDGWISTGRRLGLRIGAEYLFHQRTLTLIERDRLLEPSLEVEQTAHLGELTLDYRPDRVWSLNLSGTLANGSLGRLEGEITYSADRFDIVAQARHRFGDDLAYDLALGLAPRFAGRPTTYETLRLTLPDVEAHTDLELASSWSLSEETTLLIGGGGRRSAADRRLTVYDADHLRWTAGLRTNIPIEQSAGLELDLSYRGTAYRRPDEPDAPFAGPTVGGEHMSHLVDGSLRYVRGRRRIGGRLLTDRSFTVGLRGHVERWQLDNRFIHAVDETAAGAAVEVMARVSDHATISASYEVARDNTLASRWLAPFHGFRLGVKGHL
ncbi:MAG: hypothetical protein H6701_13030 [Myxococcales bacterium]|nr:hypothetical protein [Myxococcales bacterium]